MRRSEDPLRPAGAARRVRTPRDRARRLLLRAVGRRPHRRLRGRPRRGRRARRPYPLRRHPVRGLAAAVRGEWDFTVAGGYKYLLCPRGASFLTVTEEAQDALLPIHAGWVNGEDLWVNSYGPVRELARSARRFDEPPAFPSYHGAARSLALLEEIGIERIEAHDKALAARFRAGLVELGRPAVADDSTVVGIPGLGDRADALREAGVLLSARAGNLRASFHLYNSAADVDRALEVLAG
ncbi:cysteine desulfurase [Streptomyces laurentii]|uniref:Cysteine desulfurase n=1 Tax=Streptomyces laurentii TaxID=39478 RepID=A0A160NUU2_STRLU|nr:cysteine desulfurase [Streptomyces laurentii]